MNLFSISQLEQFSGVKAHTIRIWEQRYNALKPNRSVGNTRYYDGLQLRRLLNIVSLTGSDFKVSELCQMPDEQLSEILEKQLKQHATSKDFSDYLVSQLIAAGLNYDQGHFEKIFSNCLLRYGLSEGYSKVFYPLLVRVGLMWADNTMPPANEHFISNLIRQKLISAIDMLPPSKQTAEKWMLFLPENEFHELGLLMSHFVLSKAGKGVIYLGGNLPQDTLVNAMNVTLPSHLLFFIVHHDIPSQTQDYLEFLKNTFGNTKICLSGNEKLISRLKLGKEITWIRSKEDLEKQLI